jgi:hypothetical protein
VWNAGPVGSILKVTGCYVAAAPTGSAVDVTSCPVGTYTSTEP